MKHLRAVRPLHFPVTEPEDERLPQGRRHHHLCQALYEIIRATVSPERDTVGADQFVYYLANDPRRCLAPDVFVRVGEPEGEDFDTWMTWERGAPDVAFEVLSPSDSYERWTLRQKITRYGEMGVRELYVFNVDARPGTRLRAWDRVRGDFVERAVKDETTRSPILDVELYLDAAVVLTGTPEYPTALRARRQSHVFATQAESGAAAEARVAALEAEIARLRGPR